MKSILLATFALASLTITASAMDCEKEYRVRLDKMMAKPGVPSSDVIATTRYMLQGYDACMKGDTKTASEFFEKAGKSGG
ncbi:MAG: hypothetical protein SGJ17_13580 [Hyphomicrobiales bacterium]|nr:hypothetical protein [Hyphomicrobiales bacterium]